MEKQRLDIAEIRELADRFTAQDLELCINQQIEQGKNVCKKGSHTEKIVNELAKANFVRGLIEKGSSVGDAVRELAKRIRTFQQQGQ